MRRFFPPPARRPRPARLRPALTTLEGRELLSAVDVLTYHDDNARTGWNPSETALTPVDVNAASFGKLFTDSVDGQVYAEPLIVAGVDVPGQGVHDVLYVATEHDSVYAFDADTGAPLWKVSLLGPGETPSDPRNCGQITPEIGITATPVIDPTTGTMYVEAMSKLIAGNTAVYFQRLHALNIATGADVVPPKSIDSAISVPGKGPGGNGTDVVFDPKQYKERDALLLVNGVVYTSWASHCDAAPYTGWVMGFRASDLSLQSVLNVDPNGTPTSTLLGDGSGGSFWNSGAGPAADASGNLYNITGNGPFDPNLDANGFPVSRDYGDSYVRLSTAGGLAVADYFTPYNQQAEADKDLDMGSSGLVLVDVPDGKGGTVPLAIGSGKDGNVYVVNRNDLGKFNSTSNQIDQELPGALGGQEFGAPAYFNGTVYFGAVGATLRAFTFSGGKLSPTPSSQTATTFPYPGITPSVSSNGSSNGIVWALQFGVNDVLHAYDAIDLSKELYNSNQAAGNRDQLGFGIKFITPVVANGKVYVATKTGVSVFGLLGDRTQPPTIVSAASATPNPASGTSATLSVLGADPAYSEATLSYTWSTVSAPPGAPAPSFTANGTNAAKQTSVRFGAAGSYTFRLTVADPAGRTTSGDVGLTVVQTFSRVAVLPSGQTVAGGASVPFSAFALDQFGTPLNAQPSFAWSVDPGGLGTVSSTGVYTAPAFGAGPATVRASSGPVSGAAPISVVQPNPLIAVHVNFSNNTGQVPAGYVNDVGLPFGPKSGGLAFGWNADNSANGQDRHLSNVPGELYNSFVAMQAPSDPNASWRIAVPSGTYRVHVIAGDPLSTVGDYRIAVQGVLAIDGRPTRARRWIENTVVVNVTDGVLTVSGVRGARNNKIDAIDIIQVPSGTGSSPAGRALGRPPARQRPRAVPHPVLLHRRLR